ncbi:L,D-transpeptidase family protein [uncultured Shewanella sp.]|uniref:L,D-transpeptidase family protein n=1 Tax=uncultured Shewanella sp. TaxID=173975 RepID=UPI00262B9884|nr:L,D-transpeptidase family protein [uncultured Shewanella sp.]
MKKEKNFLYRLFISILIIWFSAVAYGGDEQHQFADNPNLLLKTFAVDLGAIENSSELINDTNLVKLLNKNIFSIKKNSYSLSAEQYLKLAERKDIEIYRKEIKYYKSLERYQWPMITPIKLRLGLRVKEVAKLRWILVKLGDMEPHTLSAYRESIYDPSVEAGLKRFQKRHGLSVNGKLGTLTLSSINTEPKVRVTQLQKALKSSLKRFDEATEYVSVNLIDYTLRISKNGVEQLNMPVIVGKPTSKTPELSTVVSSITINPTWTPPASIIYQDILQQVEKQPNYLKNNDFVLKSYESGLEDPNLAGMDADRLKTKLKNSVLVQRPGDKNALGKFRFTIPNTGAIFLHDTPNKNLFKRVNRALSHGCIRLSEPELFAKYLISKESLETQLLFQKALKNSKTIHFRLTSRLPINIVYQSVWIDKNGRLQIRDS